MILINILQVIPYYVPAYAFGGPLRVAQALSKRIVERGHRVVVATSNAASQDEVLKDSERDLTIDGAKVYRFSVGSSKIQDVFGGFITPELVKWMKENVADFDVVHIHGYRNFQALVAGHYAVKQGVPYVLQPHGSLPRTGKAWSKRIYDSFQGLKVMRGASLVLALNRKAARAAVNFGVQPDNVRILPNGIDISKYRSLPNKGSFRENYRIDQGESIILYVGRIHRNKGLDLLVRAFKTLPEDLFRSSTLVFAGPDDGYLSELRGMVSELGMESRVHFLGYISEVEKMGALVDSSAMVTPNFHGFPITFLESCIAGCPILTAKDDLDWIDGKVGYVADASIEDLRDKMAALLGSEEESKKFEKACRNMKKRFSLDNVIGRLETLYDNAICRNPS